MFSELKRFTVLALYTCALFFSVPLSLLVWFVRRELINETSVAGEKQLGVITDKERSANTSRNIETTTCPDVQLRID
ncbi:unnamed protein product [Caenorhabditis bovis]|uniref:Uncharacterized protein n=1 Tax=Caenorhabditis bovis TaxID=2654633 RepID=A0A8S1ELL4_9PELO|nr:unnamed protein product [Caenorhabditis bovis]